MPRDAAPVKPTAADHIETVRAFAAELGELDDLEEIGPE
jgi:hypothetical protein